MRKKIIFFWLVFCLLTGFFLIFVQGNQVQWYEKIFHNQAKETRCYIYEGQVTIVNADNTEKTYEKGQKIPLQEGDSIKTKSNTRVMIFWPDGSITRLGENSTVRIETSKANEDLTSVQIKFNLEKGKTWSRVVRFFSGPSFFQETLDNGETSATVRGTAFEVNLDKNYIHTSDHFVTLNNAQTSSTPVQLTEGKSVFASKINEETSTTTIDKAWQAWNTSEDGKYLQERFLAFQEEVTKMATQKTTNIFDSLLSSVQNAGNTELENQKNTILKNIAALDYQSLAAQAKTLLKNNSGSQDLHNFFLQAYQNISYVPNETEATLLTKMELRNLVVETADETEKENISKAFSAQSLLEITRKNSPIPEEKIQEILSSFPQMFETLDEAFAPLNSEEAQDWVISSLAGSQETKLQAEEELKIMKENGQKKLDGFMETIKSWIGQ